MLVRGLNEGAKFQIEMSNEGQPAGSPANPAKRGPDDFALGGEATVYGVSYTDAEVCSDGAVNATSGIH